MTALQTPWWRLSQRAGGGGRGSTAHENLAFAALCLSLAWFGLIALLGLLPNRFAGEMALRTRFGLRTKLEGEA